MKKLLLAALLLAASTSYADEKYMKLDSELDGYLVITDQQCDIQKVATAYEYKAYIESKYGIRRACWTTPTLPPELMEKITPAVNIIEEVALEDGTFLYYQGVIARYYFTNKK